MARRTDIELSMGQSSEVSISTQLMEEQMASSLALEDARAKQPEESPYAKTQTTEYVVFKLVNTNRKGRCNVDGIDDVINPKTGKMERIRLLTGIDTIWQSEQKEISADYVKQNRRSLQFEGKYLRIPKWDTSALEYARTCRSFIESPTYKQRGSRHAFFEWNPARMAEEKAKLNGKKMQAMRYALEAKGDKMKQHAYFLGVSPVDEIGIPKNDEAIGNDYFAIAERDPVRFLESYESPKVTVSFNIKKAITEGKLDLGRQQGSVYWAHNGGFIGQIPVGQNAHDYLIDLALGHTKEGKTFLSILEQISS